MIQGLLTRPKTDEIVSAFVGNGAGGTFHTDGPKFKSVDLNKPIACFGVLRGTGEIIKKAKSDVYYFDHAYLFGNRHNPSKEFGEKIYRLTKNWQHIVTIKKLTDKDKNRIEKYQSWITIKPWKKSGKDIVFCDISPFVWDYYTTKHYNMKYWFNQTVGRVKHLCNNRLGPWNYIGRPKPLPYSREVSVGKLTPLAAHLRHAYAIVTFQSTIGITALLEGVPHFCDVTSMCAPVSRTGRGESSVSKIKDPFYPDNRKEWIDSLLANQFTMSEISNGTAWEHVKDIEGEKIAKTHEDYQVPVGLEIYLDHFRNNKR